MRNVTIIRPRNIRWMDSSSVREESSIITQDLIGYSDLNEYIPVSFLYSSNFLYYSNNIKDFIVEYGLRTEFYNTNSFSTTNRYADLIEFITRGRSFFSRFNLRSLGSNYILNAQFGRIQEFNGEILFCLGISSDYIHSHGNDMASVNESINLRSISSRDMDMVEKVISKIPSDAFCIVVSEKFKENIIYRNFFKRLTREYFKPLVDSGVNTKVVPSIAEEMFKNGLKDIQVSNMQELKQYLDEIRQDIVN